MRDESSSPFSRPPPPARPLETVVFMLARVRGDHRCAARCGLAHTASSGVHAERRALSVAVVRGEALAGVDLATHHDALAAAGWTPVPFQP